MQLRKSVFFLLVSWFLTVGNLKANSGPITVEANENTTVSIFFPSPITKVIEPAAHFNFKYDPDSNLATLSAKKGKSSNLTVITQDGDIYSFALNYSENIQHFTFVISPEQAIGRRGGATSQRREAPSEPSVATRPDTSISETPAMGTFKTEEDDETPANFMGGNEAGKAQTVDSEGLDFELSEDNYVEQGSFYDIDREGYYEIFCENSYLQRTITKNNMRGNSGVDLRLNHLAVDQNEIYFTLQFRNVSKSDYRIGNVQFYIRTPGSEEVLMAPLYTYNLESFVKQSGVNKFVYVFKDFKLDPNQKVYVMMDEKEGHRNIVLPLDVKELREDLE